MNISKKIKQLREFANLTQQELADKLSISRSTLAGYESENKQPSYQVLAQIAEFFNVPTDFLLDVGVFKNWDFLLSNKEEIINYLSISLENLSHNILYGVDNITFARLVYMFNIYIEPRKDGNGISFIDPIPTYSDNPFYKNSSNYKEIIKIISSQTGEQQKEIKNLLTSFCSLNEKNKTKVLGKCFDLEDNVSVAAEEREELKQAK